MDQQQFPSMMDETTTGFTYRSPLIFNVPSCTTAGAACKVMQMTIPFSQIDCFPNGYLGQFNPDQSQRLLYMFNMFEQFRLAKVTYDYVPRWTLASQAVGKQNSNTSGIFFDLIDGSVDSQGNDADFQNNKLVTWAGDCTDITSVNSNAAATPNGPNVYYFGADNPSNLYHASDEMFQAQTKSHTRVHGIREPHSGAIIPHAFNAMSLTQTVPQAATSALDKTAPIRAPWQSCRQLLSGGQDFGFTNDNVYLGLKCWVYDPFNVSANGALGPSNPVAYGLLWLGYHFEFRGSEYRQLVSLTSFNMSSDQEKLMKEAFNRVRAKQGNKSPSIQDFIRATNFKLTALNTPPEKRMELLDATFAPASTTSQKRGLETGDQETQLSQTRTPLESFRARRG